MKLFFKYLLFVIGFSSLVYYLVQNELFPKRKTTISIEQKAINLGLVKKTDLKKVAFRIKNIGNSNFTIKNVEPDCHCTIVDWPKERISPNETALITVGYDNKITGPFQRTIKVFSNAEEEIIILTMKLFKLFSKLIFKVLIQAKYFEFYKYPNLKVVFRNNFGLG